MLESYIPIFILIGIAIFLGVLLTNLSRLMGPLRPNKIKESIYESGMDPVGSAHQRFSVKFFFIAMVFILFDIEVVFMYPWAVNYTQLIEMDLAQGGNGAFPLIEMFVFVAILFVGYIYLYKKKGFEWD